MLRKTLVSRLAATALLAALAISAGCESSGTGTPDSGTGDKTVLRSSPIRCVLFSHDKLAPGDPFTVSFELDRQANVGEDFSLAFSTGTTTIWSNVFSTTNPLTFKATGGETKFTLSGCRVKTPATWTVNLTLTAVATDVNGDGAVSSVIVTP